MSRELHRASFVAFASHIHKDGVLAFIFSSVMIGGLGVVAGMGVFAVFPAISGGSFFGLVFNEFGLDRALITKPYNQVTASLRSELRLCNDAIAITKANSDLTGRTTGLEARRDELDRAISLRTRRCNTL